MLLLWLAAWHSTNGAPERRAPGAARPRSCCSWCPPGHAQASLPHGVINAYVHELQQHCTLHADISSVASGAASGRLPKSIKHTSTTEAVT